MGDPKKARKKYQTPLHLWRTEKLDYDRKILIDYGLKNKKDIWKMESLLRKIKTQAKNLISATSEQSKKEEEQLINKLVRLGLVNAGAKMEDILALDLKNILDRRLQSIIYNAKLAKSPKQARQFIVHGHISIGDKKISSPSYIVNKDEEKLINFSENSVLKSEEHPERIKEVKEKIKKKVSKKTKEEKKEDIDVIGKIVEVEDGNG